MKTAIDFLGKELKTGDTVVCIVGHHLKKTIVEEVYPSLNPEYSTIKVKGIKDTKRRNQFVKVE